MLGEKDGINGDARLTALSLQARVLYEAGVVPVRELARLCDVSLAGLYYHVRKQRWRRRRSSVPRDLAKSDRQKQRYRALAALRPAKPRGIKARDPDGQVVALAMTERAAALSGAALARAIARQDAEAQARMVVMLSRALRDISIANGAKARPPRLNKTVKPRKKRRGYQWKPMTAAAPWSR